MQQQEIAIRDDQNSLEILRRKLAYIEQIGADLHSLQAAIQTLQAAIDRRRAADKEHRDSVNNAAYSALQEHAGLHPAQAQRVLQAIIDGLIPGISIKY